MNDPVQQLRDLLRRAAARHQVTARSKLLARVVDRATELAAENARLTERLRLLEEHATMQSEALAHAGRELDEALATTSGRAAPPPGPSGGVPC